MSVSVPLPVSAYVCAATLGLALTPSTSPENLELSLTFLAPVPVLVPEVVLLRSANLDPKALDLRSDGSVNPRLARIKHGVSMVSVHASIWVSKP